MLVSEYLEIGDELKRLGVFDAVIDKDSHFFINIVRLKHSSVPEFQTAYNLVNQRFTDIATLLDAAHSSSMDDKMFKSARRYFDFSEVNGINLGFSKSTHGSGFGNQLSLQVLGDAYQIIKSGSKQPEIFHLVSLFEENVGPDRLSDMIASIIKPNIIKYTLRVLDELGVDWKRNEKYSVDKDGLILNPYKICPILLLPVDILHKLPIARCWGDIEHAAEENEAIRREINAEVGEMWKQWDSSRRKSYLREHVFMNPAACKRIIEGYRKDEPPEFDLSSDPDYYSEVLFGKARKDIDFVATNRMVGSFDSAMEIVCLFKRWIEYNRGWDLIRGAESSQREKTVQRLFHLCAMYYVKQNNLDLSFESNAGRGPIDVKLSRGNDKTVIEIKLSSNPRYLHGYKCQVEEYAKSEDTKQRIYVLLDLGNPVRIAKIRTEHDKNLREGISCPELVIIDTREKLSASKFELEEPPQLIDDAIELQELDTDCLSGLDLGDLGIFDCGVAV